ncbi:ABC transporter permease [Porphyromonadaceae bacterium OttesenSCG-928-L07]|nr:ABC transporter permease [Porphyromonadaceae bacterium OttesenSCG-928-L07]MDL2330748.1 ABC transporter permease [Odoribacter sp. OttesenSCG-928-A06]
MRLSLFIARRYLFSKKKQNAINIISTISVIGVAIGTTALIVILSVFNGIDLLLQNSMNSLTPDIVISPATGKFAAFDTTLYGQLKKNEEINYFFPVVEENALLKYDDRLKPVTVKGVVESYEKQTHFENNIVQGNFRLKSGDIYSAVVGYGVAAELEIGLSFLTPMQFYYPNKKNSSVNTSSALYSEYLFPSAFFSSQQELDEKLVITDIRFAQKLFRIGDQISKIEIKLYDDAKIEKVKKELRSLYGNAYSVEDKYELNRTFYAMMKSEKLVIFIILVFILLIASFNIVGSISMLLLDKKEDLGTYKALGMLRKDITSIFRTEGNLITFFGGIVGLLFGSGICMLQEKYGLVTLGNGSYMMEAYPVDLIFSDVIIVLCTVLLIGFIASYFPVKYLVDKLIVD